MTPVIDDVLLRLRQIAHLLDVADETLCKMRFVDEGVRLQASRLEAILDSTRSFALAAHAEALQAGYPNANREDRGQ